MTPLLAGDLAGGSHQMTDAPTAPQSHLLVAMSHEPQVLSVSKVMGP